MIKYLSNKSYFLQLLFNNQDKNLSSKLVPRLYSLISNYLRIPSDITNKGFILRNVSALPLRSLSLIFFILFLVLVPGYDAQTSIYLKNSLVDSSANISASYFGIAIFLITLLPLSFFLFSDLKKNLSLLVFKRAEILLICFFIISLITTIYSYQLSASFVWLIKLSRNLFIYFLFATLLIRRKDYFLIIYVLLFSVFLEGILVFFQFIHGSLIGLPIESLNKIFDVKKSTLLLDNESVFRVVGTFAHSNILSTFLSAILPISIVGFYLKKKLKIYVAISFIIIMTLPLLALSRWAFAVNLFSIIITLFLLYKFIGINTKKFAYTKVILVPLLTATLLLFLIYPHFSSRFLRFSEEDISLVSRMSLISQSVTIIENNPILGIGGGNFVNFLVSYDTTEDMISKKFPNSVHNLYLLIASENGLLGLLLFSLFCLDIIIRSIKKIKFYSKEMRFICIGFLASIITILFNGLWSYRPVNDHLMIFFWMGLGLLRNLENSAKSTPRENTNLSAI